MEYIHRLPFITGAAMAVITGFISYEYGVPSQGVYIRMAVSMVVFFILGLIARNLIITINAEVEKRKHEEEEELKRLEYEEMTRNMEEKRQADNEKNTGPKSSIDFKVGEDDDEFSPLKISEIIGKSIE